LINYSWKTLGCVGDSRLGDKEVLSFLWWIFICNLSGGPFKNKVEIVKTTAPKEKT